MKKIALIGLLLIGLAACQSAEEKSLQQKKEALQQLKKERDALEQKIMNLQLAIDSAEGIVEEKRKIVQIDTVIPQRYKHAILIQGTVESDENVVVSAEASGIAQQVFVAEGDMVQKGQILVQLDDKILRNNLAEVETAYDLAKRVFEKQQNLWNQNIGSEIDYLNAKNNKERLERQIATLRSRLEQAQISSPISGKVDELLINEGEMVSIGMPVARVVDIRDVKVTADVSERYLGSFMTGDTVVLNFPAVGKQMDGVISALGSVIDPNNRTFSMVVELVEKEPWMKPNLLAKVEAYDRVIDSAIVVPTRVVHEQEGNFYVYTANGNGQKMTAKKRQIQPLFSGVEEVVISRGLSPGDQLIVMGHNNLSDGELIQPHKAQ